MANLEPEIFKKHKLHFIQEILKNIAFNKICNYAIYISYHSYGKDVILPDAVKTRYPKEITIILEHQFEELVITKNGISVVLSFDNEKSKIFVPFDSIIRFYDTYNGYNIEFRNNSEDKKQNFNKNNQSDVRYDNVISLDKFRTIKTQE